MKEANARKSFSVEIFAKDALFQIEDNNLKRSMVDRSEIVEILERMNYYRIRQTGFSRLWKQFQQQKFNKYFI